MPCRLSPGVSLQDYSLTPHTIITYYIAYFGHFLRADFVLQWSGQRAFITLAGALRSAVALRQFLSRGNFSTSPASKTISPTLAISQGHACASSMIRSSRYNLRASR